MDKSNPLHDNNNSNRNNNSDDNVNSDGEPEFTSLEIAPDYGEDFSVSGEYDNEFSSSSRRHPEIDYHAGEDSQTLDTSSGGNPVHSRTLPGTNQRRGFDFDEGAVNGGFQNDDAPDGTTVRETIEMRSIERGRCGSGGEGLYKQHHGLHHRRAKSQHQNGYDFYRQRQRRLSATLEPDPDYGDGDLTMDDPLTVRDMARTMQFLATLKVRRKRGSSKKSERGDGVNDGGEAGTDYDAEDGDTEIVIEEQVGLPSARSKLRGLTERMRMARELGSAYEVVRELKQRDTSWDVKYTPQARRQSNRLLPKITHGITDFIREVSYNINFWSQHFKEIEGQCGIATTTFFRFTRWLMKINLLVFIVFFAFLYVPQFITWAHPSKNIFVRQQMVNTSLSDKGLFESVQCSKAYVQYTENISDYTGIPVILDIVKGTGLLEDTSIFYGRYSNLSITITNSKNSTDKVTTDYNMSLVYMLVMIFSFLIIFIMIVKTSSESVRETILDLDNSVIPSYSNAVFCGWDYCINSEKMAFYKQKITYNVFQAKLEEMAIKRKMQMRTRREKIRLYAKRFGINFLVLCILGGCFTAIVFTTNFLLEKQDEDLGEIESLVIEFLPSIVITVMNFVIPVIFMLLVEKEEFSPSQSTSLTIMRAVFLRISLVGVLVFSIYYRLFHKRDREPYFCDEERMLDTTTTCCGNPLWKSSTVIKGKEKGSIKCWETYVGQQFYKLSIADFINTCVIYLGMCGFRKFIYVKFKNRVWFISKLGLQRFDLSLEVLDIVYTQTLCWVGMFFSPLLPTFCLFQTFIYFFVKKYILLQLCESPKNTYRASRSYSFFQVVLLITFTLICILLGYMVGNIQPSKGCGPFRVYGTPEHVMFDAVTNEVARWPAIPNGIFFFFGTVAFFVPAFLILGMGIYYYWAVAQGYKKLEKLLKVQLKSESYDKQYLLARVDEVIKKGELSANEEGW